MSVATSTPTYTIDSYRDSNRLIADIDAFADWHVERARLDVSADISAVFAAEEEAEELRAISEALSACVILPLSLFEDAWAALEDVAENAKPGTTIEANYRALAERLREHNPF